MSAISKFWTGHYSVTETVYLWGVVIIGIPLGLLMFVFLVNFPQPATFWFVLIAATVLGAVLSIASLRSWRNHESHGLFDGLSVAMWPLSAMGGVAQIALLLSNPEIADQLIREYLDTLDAFWA